MFSLVAFFSVVIVVVVVVIVVVVGWAVMKNVSCFLLTVKKKKVT